jgi:hypothetical protein
MLPKKESGRYHKRIKVIGKYKFPGIIHFVKITIFKKTQCHTFISVFVTIGADFRKVRKKYKPDQNKYQV